MAVGYNPAESARILARQIDDILKRALSEPSVHARGTYQSAGQMAYRLMKHLEAAALEIELAEHVALRSAARGEAG